MCNFMTNYSECSQQILWVDQLTTEDQCAGLAAWEGVKYWLPCKQKVDTSFSPETHHLLILG